jgi:hypothetical protein
LVLAAGELLAKLVEPFFHLLIVVLHGLAPLRRS